MHIARTAVSVGISSLLASLAPAASPTRHVVVMVWDGMRPDFVGEDTPNLNQLARKGVVFSQHHSVYLSATEVNGTAMSTGAYPAHNGIMANREYRPALDPLKTFETQDAAMVRKGDELSGGHYVRLPTIAELVRQAGKRTVVAGAKPVVLLADRAARNDSSGGTCVFAGNSLPAGLARVLAERQGSFPAEKSTNSSRNDWTTTALLESLWEESVPEFSFLWMNQPDVTQHAEMPGSPESRAAIRNSDANLGRVLRALDARGVRDSTDILVVSDHGFSTIATRADLAADLTRAGILAVRDFKEKPKAGDVLVGNHSGSSLIYIIGHNRELTQKIVTFLQGWQHTGVIFCRQDFPGTFSLAQAHLDTDDAPDILVSLQWNAGTNAFGVPGMLTVDRAGVGPGLGSHVSLSPFDMHNTLIACGPDFRSGMVSQTASGNVDIAPTVLWLLGIRPPKSMDGRILSEALTIEAPAPKASSTRRLEASHPVGDSIWHQYLSVTEVNGVEYFDEGNGFRSPK